MLQEGDQGNAEEEKEAEEEKAPTKVFCSPHLSEEAFYILCICIGNILQELLDGLRSTKQFDRLVQLLEPFPLLELDRSTYIAAARLRTTCRTKGVLAGPIDFLIAAACCQYGYPLLTSDQDFSRIAKHCDLIVFPD